MITTSGTVARISELLTDEENDFWSADFHERSIEEALCLIAKFKGADTLGQCIEFTTTGSATETIPSDIARTLINIESNVGGSRIREKDFEKLARLDPCFEEAEWKGKVEYYDMSCGNTKSFQLYPTPPAGHKLRLKVVPPVDQITDDMLDCEYKTAIINFSLYRAYEREGSENGNKASFYRQAFYDVMGVFKALDVEESAA